MKVFLENDFSQPVVVGMNNEFLEIYNKLSFKNQAQKYTEGMSLNTYSLKLLDGKYGNFCYLPDEFLAVSTGMSASDLSGHSIRGVYIHLHKKVNQMWDSSLQVSILFNYDHARDSLEKSSSAFARSVIKKVASFRTYQEAYQFLKDIGRSRQESFA